MTETSQRATAAMATKQAPRKPPPAPAPPAKNIALYHIDTRDTSVVAYYEEDNVSYAEAAVYINGVVPEGTFRFSVSLDGMSILWQRATHKRCFDKKLLRAIMGMRYSSSDSRVIAYDNALQEMHGSNVTPDTSNLYWGTAQVIKLTEKVMGSPVESVHPYPTKEKIQGHTQYNTLAHCRVRLAKQRVEATKKTHYKVIGLFNLQSSQESHDNDDRPPPFSPPKPRKHRNPDARGSASRKRPPPCYYINKEAKKIEESEREFGDDYDEWDEQGYK
jgi:hypothetical protein